jgi:hypothetical protein
MPSCPACGKNFTFTGYGKHLAQTSKSSCREMCEDLMAFEVTPLVDPHGQRGGSEDDAASFSGDFFGSPGDYAPEDFGELDGMSGVEENQPQWMSPFIHDDAEHILKEDQEEEEDNEEDEEDEDYLAAALEMERTSAILAHVPMPQHDEPADGEDEDYLAATLEMERTSAILAHVPMPQHDEPADETMIDPHSAPEVQDIRLRSRGQISEESFIVKFPREHAGAPMAHAEATGHDVYKNQINNPNSCWAPFTSQMDWEIARWAKLHGPGSTAFDDWLQIEGVKEALSLSYSNSRELNRIIDNKLPGRPKFQHKEIVVAGEVFDLHHRDVLECVRALFGDPEFAPHLILAPERHYADADQTNRQYHDMHTGKWWWNTQKKLEREQPGATIIPLIISSDRIQITLF